MDAPSATGGMSPEDVEELEHRIDQLSTRAAAINNSLDRLKRQQEAAGYGLRGDMAAAQANMQMNLSKAQSAMEHGDAVKAKKYTDLASASAGTLEHFLGR
jgi:outer membrane murein-binding lipoprotein Lpp